MADGTLPLGAYLRLLEQAVVLNMATHTPDDTSQQGVLL
jgi:hypothetical protein